VHSNNTDLQAAWSTQSTCCHLLALVSVHTCTLDSWSQHTHTHSTYS